MEINDQLNDWVLFCAVAILATERERERDRERDREKIFSFIDGGGYWKKQHQPVCES